MRLAFTKMQGCGNDFVVCESLSRLPKLSARRIRQLADRRFGIGFDQMLMVEPPLTPSSDFGLAIYNSDGSAAAHCGNGARCAARFVLDTKLTHKQILAWDLVTGGASSEAFTTRQISAEVFEVEMGVPSFEADAVPLRSDQGLSRTGEYTWAVSAQGQQVEFTPLNLGNPHAVIMVRDANGAPVDSLGTALGSHHAFPDGVNVGFCEPKDRNTLRLRVHERGVGETLACGSGACAAAAAAFVLGKVDNSVALEVPGGKLEVEWQGPGHGITLSGPAKVSFRGEIDF